MDIEKIPCIDAVSSPEGTASRIRKKMSESRNYTKKEIQINYNGTGYYLDATVHTLKNYFDDLRGSQELSKFLQLYPNLKSISLHDNNSKKYLIWQKNN